MTERYDVFCLGGGTAGNAATRALADAGKSVAVAEPDRVGGTCLWRGCVPKKSLYHSARSYRDLRQAEEWGLVPGAVAVDWPGVLAWKWHVQETYAGDQEGIMASRGIVHIDAPARFVAENAVEAGGVTYEAERFIIATGSVATRPPIPGAELADTSDDALRYPELPRSLVIIGAGYIGLEFAGIFASFGTKVTVVNHDPGILAPFDPDTVAVARAALEELGVRFVLDTSVAEISGVAGDLTVALTPADGAPYTVTAERVLLATGRKPALDDLGLEHVGVDRDERGAPVLDASLASTNPRIYVIGDAAGREMHTPVANLHGKAVAQTILGDSPVAVDASAVPFTCFTVPQLAQVGLTAERAGQLGIPHSTKTGSFEYVAAAIIDDTRQGLIKLVVAEDGSLLGAHIAHDAACDLIYPFALALRAGLDVETIAATRAIHPALTEAVNWSAG